MAQSDISKGEQLPITITGRHFEVTSAVEAYVTDKIFAVAKMTDKIMDVAVVLEAEKIHHSCSIRVNFPHYHIHVNATTDNMYSAIDKGADKLFGLISKYKAKLHPKTPHLAAIDIEVNVIRPSKDNLKRINDDIEEATSRKEADRFELHEVVSKETVSVKIHTQEEAIMRMEFSNDPFMIYRSEEDQKVKILYRRPDGNYNLVQVQ